MYSPVHILEAGSNSRGGQKMGGRTFQVKLQQKWAPIQSEIGGEICLKMEFNPPYNYVQEGTLKH